MNISPSVHVTDARRASGDAQTHTLTLFFVSSVPHPGDDVLCWLLLCSFKENLNTSRSSEHPPVRGKKMSKALSAVDGRVLEQGGDGGKISPTKV